MSLSLIGNEKSRRFFFHLREKCSRGRGFAPELARAVVESKESKAPPKGTLRVKKFNCNSNTRWVTLYLTLFIPAVEAIVEVIVKDWSQLGWYSGQAQVLLNGWQSWPFGHWRLTTQTSPSFSTLGRQRHFQMIWFLAQPHFPVI